MGSRHFLAVPPRPSPPPSSGSALMVQKDCGVIPAVGIAGCWSGLCASLPGCPPTAAGLVVILLSTASQPAVLISGLCTPSCHCWWLWVTDPCGSVVGLLALRSDDSSPLHALASCTARFLPHLAHFNIRLSLPLAFWTLPLISSANYGISPLSHCPFGHPTLFQGGGGGGMGKTVKCARKRMGDAKMYWGNKGDMPNSAGGGVQVT